MLVVAFGGNALLQRGEAPVADVQQNHVHRAASSLVPVAESHDLVVTHGNGPQVGLLAQESAADSSLPGPYPFDALGAQTQGMIGYWLVQAFESTLPGRQVAGLICQTLVDAEDPAFHDPTKFVGPAYDEARSTALQAAHGWQFQQDGTAWRRVVASPEPLELLELSSIRHLLAQGALVVCAGGGGIPVYRKRDGSLRGAEAVVDKDLTSALLARELGAEALLILTDVEGVQLGFGTTEARTIRHTTPDELRTHDFAAGSMAPKVAAACRFVEATGRPAMIGRMEDVVGLLDGTRGTRIEQVPGT